MRMIRSHSTTRTHGTLRPPGRAARPAVRAATSPPYPVRPRRPSMTPVEFIGMIGTRVVSEVHPASGPPLDPAVVRRFVDAHEQGGFDQVLVGHSASTPDGLQVAAYGAAHSERLGFLVAHRPGFVAPTLAARSFATLDQFSGGRVAMHVISGGNDADQRRDGDHLDKDARYRRTDED